MNIKNKIKNILPQKMVTQYKEILLYKKDIDRNIEEPNIYNDKGERIRTFYLCDVNCGLDLSLTAGQQSQYIQWDRSRYTLPIHFYTDDMIWVNRGKPKKKFAMLLEPMTLQPAKYNLLLRDPNIVSDYEALFTYSGKLLDAIPNAKPYITGGVYIGTEFGGGLLSDDIYNRKEKNISMVSSNKRTCELHRLRFDLASRLNKGDKVDCYGTFNGKYIKIWDSLEKYRYSIVIENEIDDYWITERICNCFACLTVPIYLGSPKIGNFFNSDGIIALRKNDISSIDKIISKCCKEDYLERLPAMRDNFNRVKSYYCKEDWLYSHYEELFK